MTNRNAKTKNLVLAALCIALCLLLPLITGQNRQLGNMLCLIHLPVYICAYLTNWKWAGAVGFVSPILRSFTFGMPPLYPLAIGMAFEMATYGIVAAVFYKVFKKSTSGLYASLLIAMLLGRIVGGSVKAILLGVGGEALTFKAFLTTYFVTEVAGIAIQIILIPLLVLALGKALKNN